MTAKKGFLWFVGVVVVVAIFALAGQYISDKYEAATPTDSTATISDSEYVGVDSVTACSHKCDSIKLAADSVK